MRTTLLSMLAACLAFAFFRPPPLAYGPGLYQSRMGSVVYFDEAAFEARPVIFRDAPVVASGKAGYIERRGIFRIDEVVPGGARITLLSGDRVGKPAWMTGEELTFDRNGKVWRLDGRDPNPDAGGRP